MGMYIAHYAETSCTLMAHAMYVPCVARLQDVVGGLTVNSYNQNTDCALEIQIVPACGDYVNDYEYTEDYRYE